MQTSNVRAATVACHVLHTFEVQLWGYGCHGDAYLSSLCVCRSEGKTCGVCMEQVMAKLMRSERRFGIMCKRIRTVFLLSWLNSCMHGCHATRKNIVLCSTLAACGKKDGLVHWMRFHEDVWESLGRRQLWMMHETNKPGTMLINCRGQQRFLSYFYKWLWMHWPHTSGSLPPLSMQAVTKMMCVLVQVNSMKMKHICPVFNPRVIHLKNKKSTWKGAICQNVHCLVADGGEGSTVDKFSHYQNHASPFAT